MFNFVTHPNDILFLDVLANLFIAACLGGLVFVVLIGVSRAIQSAIEWITDNKDDNVNCVVSSFNSVFKISGYSGDGWYLFSSLVCLSVLITFYKVGILGLIVFAIMYLARSVVRLKTTLSTHIENKKAHK